MRKVALICVATVVGALGITAVASAIQGTQTVSRLAPEQARWDEGQAAQRRASSRS